MENNGYSLANPKSFRHTQNSPRDGERDCAKRKMYCAIPQSGDRRCVAEEKSPKADGFLR